MGFPRAGSRQSVGANSKEELMQLIGAQWRQMQRDQKEANAERIAKGPQTGDRRARSAKKKANQAAQSHLKKWLQKAL